MTAGPAQEEAGDATEAELSAEPGQSRWKDIIGDPIEEEPDPFDWHVPWHAFVPGAALAAAMGLAWLASLGSGMASWGISGAALAQGRFETIPLHMFAHGGLFHILMNGLVLLQIGGPVVERLGGWPKGWTAFPALFVLSGLAGTALFLAIHPSGEVPMLGASGALYGLIGLLLRLQGPGEELMPIRSKQMRLAAIQFFKDNLFLIVILTVPALLAGTGGGVAWEAHLGGFLFGIFVAPHLFRPGQRVAGREVDVSAPNC